MMNISKEGDIYDFYYSISNLQKLGYFAKGN